MHLSALRTRDLDGVSLQRGNTSLTAGTALSTRRCRIQRVGSAPCHLMSGASLDGQFLTPLPLNLMSRAPLRPSRAATNSGAKIVAFAASI